MGYSKIFTLLVIVSFFPTGVAASSLLPGEFSRDPVMIRGGAVKTWLPETMYEHVNGEAELLRRYGARCLSYAAYKSGPDAYFSIDLLDMGLPINAYGLYRLYAGCDGEEFITSGAAVLAGDWTYYAQRGRYFMRIDVEGINGKQAVTDFLAAFSGIHPSPEPLPETLGRLQKATGKACGVQYHPEDVDYDLKAGPGYSWEDPDEGIYYLRYFETAKQSNSLAAALMDRGARQVRVRGSAVAWPKEPADGALPYLDGVLESLPE